jgi:hypothetical protein
MTPAFLACPCGLLLAQTMSVVLFRVRVGCVSLGVWLRSGRCETPADDGRAVTRHHGGRETRQANHSGRVSGISQTFACAD